MSNNNEDAGDGQRTAPTASDRKLLKLMGSPWYTWGMALIFASISVTDYLNHQFSWIDGLMLAVWGIMALIELTAIIFWRQNNKHTRTKPAGN